MKVLGIIVPYAGDYHKLIEMKVPYSGENIIVLWMTASYTGGSLTKYIPRIHQTVEIIVIAAYDHTAMNLTNKFMGATVD